VDLVSDSLGEFHEMQNRRTWQMASMNSKPLTFAELPYHPDLDTLSSDIAILGIPYGTPYVLGEPPHTLHSSAIIREESVRYPEDVVSWDFDFQGLLLGEGKVNVVDCGDLPGDPSDPVGNRNRAQKAIQQILKKGAVPIVFGGDDSVPIPVFEAFEDHGPIHILQIDAHIDWRNEIDDVKYGYSSNMRRTSEMPWVDKIIQVGIRGVGTARMEEYKAALSYGAQIITAQTVHKNGIDQVLSLVPSGSSCYITMDCDGLDPSVIPAVGAPAPGGLTYTQVIQIIHGLTQKTNLVGFNLVEFVPEKDVNGLGSVAASRILWNVIGALVRSKSKIVV
jgi:agmatinase